MVCYIIIHFYFFKKFIKFFCFLAFPAADGTPCDSGKSCFQGQCVADAKSPNGTCIFGDDYVYSSDIPMVVSATLPLNPTCQSTLDYLQQIKLVDFVYACQLYLQTRCCETCASKNY